MNISLTCFLSRQTATDEARLREVFEIFGTVTSVKLHHLRNMPGFGYVRFSSRASAHNAKMNMHQSQLDGQTLHVRITNL